MLRLLKELVRLVFRLFARESVSRSFRTRAGGGSGGAEQPNWEAQCSLVRMRVERYRDESLCYQLGLERHRRNAPRDVLVGLLDGHEQVMSRPVLYLNSDKWKWDQQRLQDAVARALGDLGLDAPTGVREPTSQAERACDDWAVAKAKRQFDRIPARVRSRKCDRQPR